MALDIGVPETDRLLGAMMCVQSGVQKDIISSADWCS